MKKAKAYFAAFCAVTLFSFMLVGQPREARADTGTCCYQPVGVCVVGTVTINQAYYLSSGPCPISTGGPGGGTVDPPGGGDPIIKM